MRLSEDRDAARAELREAQAKLGQSEAQVAALGQRLKALQASKTYELSSALVSARRHPVRGARGVLSLLRRRAR